MLILIFDFGYFYMCCKFLIVFYMINDFNDIDIVIVILYGFWVEVINVCGYCFIGIIFYKDIVYFLLWIFYIVFIIDLFNDL